METSSTALMSFVCVVYLLIACSTTSHSQVYLQIEKFNSPKTLKLVPGSLLEFKLHAYPKTWRKGPIEYILYDEQTIAVDGDIFHIDEFKDVRFDRPWAKPLGKTLVTFSGAWFGYGLIITVFDDNFTFGKDTLAVGIGSFVAGVLIQKIFGKKKFKLGKNSRLRVVDLRF